LNRILDSLMVAELAEGGLPALLPTKLDALTTHGSMITSGMNSSPGHHFLVLALAATKDMMQSTLPVWG
jgi:hypothetical protein